MLHIICRLSAIPEGSERDDILWLARFSSPVKTHRRRERRANLPAYSSGIPTYCYCFLQDILEVSITRALVYSCMQDTDVCLSLSNPLLRAASKQVAAGGSIQHDYRSISSAHRACELKCGVRWFQERWRYSCNAHTVHR